MQAVHEEQSRVQDWFNSVYQTRGLNYLRPPEAYPIFLQLLETQPERRLLDVACGPGLLLRAARERGLEAQGIDLSNVAVSMVPEVARGATATTGNAENLPFPDGSFDYITCIGSLERFIHRDKALAEMKRVARKGARLCLMVRNSQTFGWKVATEWLGRINTQGHQDADTLESWSSLFSKNGFEIKRVVPDQWFYQKWRIRFFKGGSGAEEPVVSRLAPLRFANEFIFILNVPG